MHLEFENKKPIAEILNDAKKYNYDYKLNTEDSLLIKGDNFKGMSFLLNNGYKNKIDLVYIDPPFNTKQNYYISENRSNTISMSNDSILAYKDNFSLDEYLEFMRERLVLIYEMLSEKGSLYVHIDIKTGHYIKVLLDELFGSENFKNDITRIKSNPKNFDRTAYGNQKDIILFYVKNNKKNIWNNVYIPLNKRDIEKRYPKVDKDGNYTTIPLHAPGVTINGATGKPWRGLYPPEGRHWRTDPKEFDILDAKGLIEWSKNGNPRIKKYVKDHKGIKSQDIWEYKDPQNPIYPTQKNQKLLEFIIQKSSNPDSTVLDCFAGGGTTLTACTINKRRWIGIDNSNQSIITIQKHIKTKYDFLDLSYQ